MKITITLNNLQLNTHSILLKFDKRKRETAKLCGAKCVLRLLLTLIHNGKFLMKQ